MKAYECKLKRVDIETVVSETKVGGNPTFQNDIEWPKCKSCGKDMNFIFQLSLNFPAQVSNIDAMSYVFMCPGTFNSDGILECETWDYQSGANIVIVQELSEKTRTMVKGEVLPQYIIKFEEFEEPNIEFYYDEIDEEVFKQISEKTKVLGNPAWLQDDGTPKCSKCGKKMKFVAQINSELDGPLSSDPRKWKVEDKNFLDFGGDGIGYLFICEDESHKCEGAFLWQCT